MLARQSPMMIQSWNVKSGSPQVILSVAFPSLKIKAIRKFLVSMRLDIFGVGWGLTIIAPFGRRQTFRS
jgi:hypothetical protein